MDDLVENKIGAQRKFFPFFTIPNIIGYFRLALLPIVVMTAIQSPLIAFIVYFISANLDAIDGFLARKFNQQSRVGTMLDYAIDRTSDVLMFVILIMVYPREWEIFTLLLMLDIFSHVCQLYSTVFSKVNSHKLIAQNQGIMLKLYYSNRIILYSTCASHDMWLACLYLYHFYPSTWIFSLGIGFFPGFAFKTVIHLQQIISVFKVVSETEQIVETRQLD